MRASIPHPYLINGAILQMMNLPKSALPELIQTGVRATILFRLAMDRL